MFALITWAETQIYLCLYYNNQQSSQEHKIIYALVYMCVKKQNKTIVFENWID